MDHPQTKALTGRDAPEAPRASDRFQVTHWSLLGRAADSQALGSREALETLCRDYWRPIHGFILSRGVREADAQDLTQAFLVRLIASKALREADPALGRFRSFLLGALKHFLTDEWRKQHAARRGGHAETFSIEEQEYGSRCPTELATEAAGEAVFDKEWALTLIERAMEGVQARWEERGKGPLFEVLREYLVGNDPSGGYEAAATRLGLSVEAVKTHIHRLRRDYRDILRLEICGTLGDAAEIDAELRYLCKALAS